MRLSMRRQRRRRPMKGECHRKALEDEFGSHESGSEEGAGGGGRAANSGTIGEWHYGCLARQRSSAIMWRIRSQRAIDCQEKESANWNHPLKQMEEENASMHEETRRLRDEQQFSDCSCGNLGFFSLSFRSCDTPIRREGGKVAPPPPNLPILPPIVCLWPNIECKEGIERDDRRRGRRHDEYQHMQHFACAESAIADFAALY